MSTSHGKCITDRLDSDNIRGDSIIEDSENLPDIDILAGILQKIPNQPLSNSAVSMKILRNLKG